MRIMLNRMSKIINGGKSKKMGTETDSLLSAVEEPPSCSPHWADWKWQLKNSLNDVEKLSKFFQLKAQEARVV